MSAIVIPSKFEEKLPKGSFVYTLLKNVEPLLKSSDYFPEYTLHDETHINNVLEYSEKLIPPKIFGDLSDRAIEILVSAAILHDLGLFIKQAGIKQMIFGDYKDQCTKHLDKKTWNEEWQEFYKKIRRYNDRELIRLFGDANPIEKLPDNDIHTDDTKRQRLIYGEFIRKNHARLAHHISIFGFPGDVVNDIYKDCALNDITKDYIGLVARGHGMKTLREAAKFLEKHPSPLRDIPIYYLIAILQISDTLDVGSKRAPIEREHADELWSPESKRQFKINQVITNEPTFDFCKKWVYVDATPKCSETFTGVEALLEKIQRELDTNLAVVVVMHGSNYGFSVNRVESNMFDEDRVTSITAEYLARGAALGVNPDIVKLLIEPLYDNDPSFGVRELIQNAVDACRERENHDGTVGEIRIDIDLENKKFIISDNGIGMDEDILRNYYLIAGSSYRYSDVWRANHLMDDGKSSIARSGRFGVGALAAFLIGDEVKVTTRHYGDITGYGYQFTYTIKPDLLDVVRVNKNSEGLPVDIGTIIEIKVHDRFLEYCIWGGELNSSLNDSENSVPYDLYKWYYHDKPQVKYFSHGKQIATYNQTIPPKGINKDGWFDVEGPTFPKMKLKFQSDSTHPEFIVNGININYNNGFVANDYGCGLLMENSGYDVNFPLIAINDYDNKLNINLNRTAIIGFQDYDFVIEEAFKYQLARILALPLEKPSEIAAIEIIRDDNIYKIGRETFIVSRDGFTLCQPTFLNHLQQEKILMVYQYLSKLNTVGEFEIPIAYKKFTHDVLEFDPVDGYIQNNKYRIKDTYTNYWLMLPKTIRYPKDFLNNESREYHDLGEDCWNIALKGKPLQHSPIPLSANIPLIIEHSISRSGMDGDDKNIMLKVLRDFLPADLNSGFIPFKMEERKKMFPKAFDELGRYMQDCW